MHAPFQIGTQLVGREPWTAVFRHGQRRDARNVGTGHRRPLHVAVGVARKGAVHGVFIAVTPLVLVGTARSGHVDPLRKVRVIALAIVGRQCRHGKHPLVTGGIAAVVALLVAGREDHDAALHRPDLHAVLVETGVFDEIVDGILGDFGHLVDVGVSPAVLTDDGSRVGAVFERHDLVAVVVPVLGEHLAADYPHAGVPAATAGDTANADTVAVLGSDRSSDVRAMFDRRDVVRSHRISRGIDEVPAVDVVDIAVPVIVHTLFAVELGPVADIADEVFVRIVDASVHDRHDHVVRSGGHLPRPKQIDVGSGDGIGHRSVVGIVPLLRKPRIVERQRGGSLRGRQRSRDGPLGPDTPDRIDRLDALNPFEPRQIERRPRHGTQRIEPDVVPAIQSGTARARLEAARRREDALHPRDAERRDGAIQRLGTRLQPAAGLDDPLRNLSLFELDAKAPRRRSFPRRFPDRLRRLLSDRIGGAGGQQRQRTKGDMQPAFLFE